MAPTKSVFIPVDIALGQGISRIQALGAKISDFTAGSAARTILESGAVVVSNGSAVADQLQRDGYLDTATGDALDALGLANWQVARKAAVQATGEITITRQDTAGTLSIPAGWSQLATSPAAPGQLGVAVLTTADADFADGVATATVAAQAVLGGNAGNLTNSIFLTPLSPVAGVSSQNGYQVTTPFANGVDAETDDAYRARVPITVQGRVLGRRSSFLAAALSVPGVLSANVLSPGDTRGDATTLTAGEVEVYYQGSAGLLGAVTSAVNNAAGLSQAPQTFASVSLTGSRGLRRVIEACDIYCLPGTDTVQLGNAAAAAIIAFVSGSGVGNTCYYSGAVEALLAVPGVITVDLPFTSFHLSGGSGAGNITVAADSYADLAVSDAVVNVHTLT